MAIIVEQQKKKINWVAIAGVASIFIFLIAATYYFFFAPKPFIEFIAPPELQTISKLSQIDISLDSVRQVTNHPVEDLLKTHIAPPLAPQTGRINPFIAF